MKRKLSLMIIFIVIISAAVTITVAVSLFAPFYAVSERSGRPVKIVLEENPGYLAREHTAECTEGENVSFELEMIPGVEITGCDYDGDYEISKAGEGVKLTLYDVKRTKVVSVGTKRQVMSITYHAEGGKCISGDAGKEIKTETERHHLKVNTARVDELFERDGYTLAGWQKKGKKSAVIPCGSRIDYEEKCELYAVWKKWSAKEAFLYRESGDGIMITGLSEDQSLYSDRFSSAEKSGRKHSASSLVIPGYINGKKVYGIDGSAFAGIKAKELFLPTGLLKVSDKAFEGAAIHDVWLPDDIKELSGRAFQDAKVSSLYITAAAAPVYSGNYFDGFSDKLAALCALKDEKKIVLFSGSSARFGYDSRMIGSVFRDYRVVNMGVFAYTNALPQLDLIKGFMREGDILLMSPEFDASQSQFCVSRDLEWHIFAMTEGDHSMISRLNPGDYDNFWTALSTYLKQRSGMEKRSYDYSIFEYEENGKKADAPVYNSVGDYVLYRENAADDTPIYDLPVNYTVKALLYDTYIMPFNRVCRKFTDRGIKVLFTYAPRNKEAISEESTKKERRRLDSYLRDSLEIPVISDIEDSLFDGRYLYGTDNHLSTEGVRIRTEKTIEELKGYV